MIIDCGIGVTRRSVQASVSLLDIEMILVTHLHSDQVLKLGPFVCTAWARRLRRSVKVLGPNWIDAYWDGFLASISFDHDIRVDDEGRAPTSDLVEVRTYGEGPIVDTDEIGVLACRVWHPLR